MTKRTPDAKPADKVTHEAPEEAWVPRAVVVYQDRYNAPATIVQANENHTLDLRADLFGLGREIILYGVARRQVGGNGWEPVE